LAIIFALKKFHQFLYGRHFILVTDHKPLLALFNPGKATPALAANRLARWALLLSQYDYSIEYRQTKDHGNADALSRLPASSDKVFDGEEDEEDIETVCSIKAIKTLDQQLHSGTNSLAKESAKDPAISLAIRFSREGWPATRPKDLPAEDLLSLQGLQKVASALSSIHSCLLYGNRVVIPKSLRGQVLTILHLGHFGMQRMKQLARTAVYWPGIDQEIADTCHSCTSCAEHQNKPEKPPVHPWMLPEKPWSRIHIDHAINFMGSNWLVLVDAYSKYPCIHPTSSTSTKATTELLEQDFAHFGYPHTIVSDNATSFMSEEFKQWCKERGIIHLTGAPYCPATNGAAERLVQTFKQALKKSTLPPKVALQEFLMMYRRTPLAMGQSPSELLNGRQIRTKIDTLLPSPAHVTQGRQVQPISKVGPVYKVGQPVYALYYGPRQDKDPRWVPAIVTKVFGSRSYNVKVTPKGPTWRRHVGQLRLRHVSPEDTEPGEDFDAPAVVVQLPTNGTQDRTITNEHNKRRNPRLPTSAEYGPDKPRRSSRQRKAKVVCDC